ncbi:hypothetical protein [Streptomyces sp. NRRL F-2747]|uniref:hypothetical protein n=1 Tax=Streptomyces sp. NRRL F-2747 TaxID=1463843 RepID=UPI00068ECD69|nr:hypothetical protein [Streptomyces sp. NRRL F-2747]
MTNLLPRCGDEMPLTSAELDFFQERDDEAEHELNERCSCSLQAEHTGHHTALAQCLGGTEWWLSWGKDGSAPPFARLTGGKRLLPLGCCPAVNPRDKQESCLLFESHDGAHSFFLEPEAAPVPSRKYRAMIAADLRSEMAPDEERYLLATEAFLEEPVDAVLPLLTAHEAMAVTVLLTKLAGDEWLVEGHVEELVSRLEGRMVATGVCPKKLLSATA